MHTISNIENKITRAAFRADIIEPLERLYKTPVYYNGEHKHERIYASRIAGIYCPSNHIIIIRFGRCVLHTLGTLVHEVAHSRLHRVSVEQDSFRRPYAESEAYWVQFKVLQKLGFGSKIRRSCWSAMYDDYISCCIDDDLNIYPLRYKMLNGIVNELVAVLRFRLGRPYCSGLDCKHPCLLARSHKAADKHYMHQMSIVEIDKVFDA